MVPIETGGLRTSSFAPLSHSQLRQTPKRRQNKVDDANGKVLGSLNCTAQLWGFELSLFISVSAGTSFTVVPTAPPLLSVLLSRLSWLASAGVSLRLRWQAESQSPGLGLASSASSVRLRRRSCWPVGTAARVGDLRLVSSQYVVDMDARHPLGVRCTSLACVSVGPNTSYPLEQKRLQRPSYN